MNIATYADRNPEYKEDLTYDQFTASIHELFPQSTEAYVLVEYGSYKENRVPTKLIDEIFASSNVSIFYECKNNYLSERYKILKINL